MNIYELTLFFLSIIYMLVLYLLDKCNQYNFRELRQHNLGCLIIIIAGDYTVLDDVNITTTGNYSGRYRSYRGVAVPTQCPAGSYCPIGSEYETHYLCPPGTYSNSTGLSADTQCTPCTPGSYCSGEGKCVT